MIIIDTSIWIDHLHRADSVLLGLLDKGTVLTHPHIIEELACGSIANRVQFLALLRRLPFATVASHDEVLKLIESEKLYSRGLGATDVHLIASAKLSASEIWSRDKALTREAARLGLS